MHYLLRNQGMNVKIHRFSIKLYVLSRTTIQQKCGATYLHSWLYTLGGFGSGSTGLDNKKILIPYIAFSQN